MIVVSYCRTKMVFSHTHIEVVVQATPKFHSPSNTPPSTTTTSLITKTDRPRWVDQVIRCAKRELGPPNNTSISPLLRTHPRQPTTGVMVVPSISSNPMGKDSVGTSDGTPKRCRDAPPTIFGPTDMTDQSASPIFKLPPELRNAIYSLVFQDHTVEVVSVERYLKAQPPGLLITCKQLYTEAVEVYYSNVAAEGKSVDDVFDWALRMPKQYYNLVPELRIVHRRHSDYTYLDSTRIGAARIYIKRLADYMDNQNIEFRAKRVVVVYRTAAAAVSGDFEQCE